MECKDINARHVDAITQKAPPGENLKPSKEWPFKCTLKDWDIGQSGGY